MSTPKPPEILDKIVDVVLAHRAKPKSKAAKRRSSTSPLSKRKTHTKGKTQQPRQ
jgi:hypothetical protein